MRVVETYGELHQAVQDQVPVIGVGADIVVEQPLNPRGPLFRLLGAMREGEELPHLDFSPFQNDYDEPEKNGIHINSPKAYISGLAFSGYEHRGSLLKGHATEELVVTGCSFKDIGRKYFPPRDPLSGRPMADYVSAQVIGSHGATRLVRIENCSFIDCSTQCHRWAHAIYASGVVLEVLGCYFARTGNPLALGGYVMPELVNVTGNTFGPTALNRWPVEPEQWWLPYLITVGAVSVDKLTFSHNVIKGSWNYPYRIQDTEANGAYFNHNDFSQANWDVNFAMLPGIGYIDDEEWRARGRDLDSIFPTDLRR